MSYQPTRDDLRAALNSIPSEDHQAVADRLGVPLDSLLEHAIDALAVFDEIEIERGEGVPPELVEEWVEHLMCEYT
jgi:hypothetical protein